MRQFKLTTNILVAEEIEKFLRNENCGAEVIFCGSVRSSSIGEEVVALEFEAYEPMVSKELNRIADQIELKWKVHSIALHHRLGKVEVGELAVIAAIASTHRKEAFEACQFLMDQLKTSVPIWKKEILTSGEVWVSAFP
jgi:molybdopterin synthase catalytic subunit